MKIVINTIAVIVLSVQFFSFAFNALNQKKSESTLESLYNYFNFTALLCSLLSVVIFIAVYNFNSKFLKKRFPNCIMLIIALLGIYVHITQVFVLNDFVLTSCVLLLFDYYIMRNILNNLFFKIASPCQFPPNVWGKFSSLRVFAVFFIPLKGNTTKH